MVVIRVIIRICMGLLFEGIPGLLHIQPSLPPGEKLGVLFHPQNIKLKIHSFFFFYVVLVLVFVQEIANLEFRKCCLIG